MAQKQWVFDPNSGGEKIPARLKEELKKRIETYAAQHHAGQYTRLDFRFRAQFCYVDAYQEPMMTEGWPPEDWPETREEYATRLRNMPQPLCRLRYFGGQKWGVAFFLYSSEKYETSMLPNGSFFGTPEEIFGTAMQFLA